MCSSKKIQNWKYKVCQKYHNSSIQPTIRPDTKHIIQIKFNHRLESKVNWRWSLSRVCSVTMVSPAYVQWRRYFRRMFSDAGISSVCSVTMVFPAYVQWWWYFRRMFNDNGIYGVGTMTVVLPAYIQWRWYFRRMFNDNGTCISGVHTVSFEFRSGKIRLRYILKYAQ
jgi:hypothetical protein